MEEKKERDSTVTIVEGATRHWLGASILVCCILLSIFALDVRDTRQTVQDFPIKFNSSCHDAVYTVQQGIATSLITLSDSAQNITNTEYLRLIGAVRYMLKEFVGLGIQEFLNVLQSINPLVYCTLNGGLGLVSSTEQTLIGISQTPFTCSISPISGVDICSNIQPIEDLYNSITGGISSTISKWPKIQPGLTSYYDELINSTGLYTYLHELATFDAPPYIVNVNSTQAVNQALQQSTSFTSAAQGCVDIMVSFNEPSSSVANVLFWVEFALWVLIVLIVIFVFVWGIVREAPGAFVTWINLKVDRYFISSIQSRATTPYAVWFLRYINFRLVMLTTLYGCFGILVAFGLGAVTSQTEIQINVWTNQSLSTSLNTVQSNIQNGIDETIWALEDQLNAPLRNSPIGSVPTIIGLMINETDSLLSYTYLVLDSIGAVPGIGSQLQSAVECAIPFSSLYLVQDMLGVVVSIVQDICYFQINLPLFTFPNLAGIGVSAVNASVTYIVNTAQARIRRYQIVFILLTIAIGVLMLQGALIIALKEIIKRRQQHKQQPQQQPQQPSSQHSPEQPQQPQPESQPQLQQQKYHQSQQLENADVIASIAALQSRAGNRNTIELQNENNIDANT